MAAGVVDCGLHLHEPRLVEGAGVEVDGVPVDGRPVGQRLVVLESIDQSFHLQDTHIVHKDDILEH